MIEGRDKFLTEAMGECWHNKAQKTGIFSYCDECHTGFLDLPGDRDNFSAWPGFGKLWEWAQKQEWWHLFYDKELSTFRFVERIHPDRFADALYAFLKDKQWT